MVEKVVFCKAGETFSRITLELDSRFGHLKQKMKGIDCTFHEKKIFSSWSCGSGVMVPEVTVKQLLGRRRVLLIFQVNFVRFS